MRCPLSQASPVGPGVRPGTLLEGHWVVETLLRAGPAGVDLRCHHATDPTRRVVIKLFQDSDPDAWRRFQREASVLKRVRHPTLVHAETAQLRAEPPYMVLQPTEGPDLRAVLEHSGALPLVDALAIARDLCGLLMHLHAQSIYHRDLRPANVVLTAQGPRVVQLGVAPEGGFGRLTQPGRRLGDIQYAPPEWARPDPNLAAQWDLYALGLTLHAMLVGEEPFQVDESLPEVERPLRLTKRKRATPFLDPGPRFPELVRVLVRRLTHVDPEQRPASAREVYNELRTLLEDHSGDAAIRPSPPPELDVPPPSLDAPIRETRPAPTTLVPMAARAVRGNVVVIPTDHGDAPMLVSVRSQGLHLSRATVAGAMVAAALGGAGLMALFGTLLWLWLS